MVVIIKYIIIRKSVWTSTTNEVDKKISSKINTNQMEINVTNFIQFFDKLKGKYK